MRALTEQSERLLAPVRTAPDDRLGLSLNREGSRFLAHIYAKHQSSVYADRIYAPSFNAEHTFLERVPERKQVEDDPKFRCTWELGATDITAAVIAASWKEPQLVFEEERARTTFQYLLLSSAAGEISAETVARYKEDGTVPEDGLVVNAELPLAGYQRVGANVMRLNEGYALHMQQGTGKTPPSIAVICNDAEKVFREQQRQYRVLIVCPKNVRANWRNEFERFRTCPGTTTVMRGGWLERTKLFIDAITSAPDARFTVIIMSYECMTKMVDTLCSVQWDRCILDEAHYIKYPESKRARAALKLRDSCDNRNTLTGTPVCNSVLDVYAQLEFLRRGGSGFVSWKAFRKFYGVWEKSADFSGREKLVALQNLPFMRERLAKMSYTVTKAEVMPDLPDKLYDIVEVEMSSAQREAYENLRDQLVLEVENDMNSASDSNRAMVVNNVLTKLLRLAQVTSGFLQFAEERDDLGKVLMPKEVRYFDPNPKLDALVELLGSDEPTCKGIIWAHWVPDLEAIHERMTNLNMDHVMYYGGTSERDREDAERRFNYDPACRWLVGSAGAGGTGLNLIGHPPGPEGDDYDTDCGRVVYYSQDWSHPKRSQSEDRAHRRGTRRPVQVTDLCVPNTIDEEIRARVMKKRVHAMEISDVRAILSAILHGISRDEE